MSNLLAANIRRLRKEKLLWIFIGAMLLSSIFMVVMGGNISIGRNLDHPLDFYYFRTMMYAGILYAAFISLFGGTEFSDGTLRNKLIVGHTRKNVYLADLLTNYVAVTGIFLAWLIGSMAGIPILGTWSVGIGGWIIDSLVILFLGFASASLYTLLSHCITSKAACAVWSILLELAQLLTASYFYNALCEPETTYSYSQITANGIEYGDVIPNPSYVTGTMRDVYEWILNILPDGQILKVGLDYAELTNQAILICISIVLVVIISFIGCVLFEKKDLK